MKRHPKILFIIENALNKFKLREKILILFAFCVIFPLMCIDGIIINSLIVEERAEELNVSETMADSVASYLASQLNECQNISASISQNYKVGEVLANQYVDSYDYYDQYYRMTDNYFFQTLTRFENMRVKLYTSNDTVIGGGYVGKISEIEDTDWYKEYKNSEQKYIFKCDYEESRTQTESKRRIYYIGSLKFNNNRFENFIRIDLDYSTVARGLENMGHAKPIYVCDEDVVLLSNMRNNSTLAPFEKINSSESILYEKNEDKLGNFNRIVIIDEGSGALDVISNSKWKLLIVFMISIVLPLFVLFEIDYSIVHRIELLNDVFGKRVNEDELAKVDEPEGSDEIASLMRGYNVMADEVNSLIQTVYKGKLREQESNLARQNAELLALHSQINPHFMFNALESIRMHSVIKGENETAEMVEKLATMERQYVDWGQDKIMIGQEMASVEAYLTLQKYRFGDRLMYELNIEEGCKRFLIPKLTMVTFVENACIHGMENKTSGCWVFVRVYKQKEEIVIEIEDTGNGMEEDTVRRIMTMAKTIEIEDVKRSSHVGIYNALLRLRMTLGDQYEFEIESEEGIGTMIQIRIDNSQEVTC